MSSERRSRRKRAAKNEQSFQSYNERRVAMEESGGTPDDEAVPFVCECDDPECSRAIEVPLGEYERAVEAPDRFVVVPGHEDPAVEVVVEIRENFLSAPLLEDGVDRPMGTASPSLSGVSRQRPIRLSRSRPSLGRASLSSWRGG